MFWFYFFIFFISFLLLHYSCNLLIKSLIKIGENLRWREFIVAFFIIAFASSLPNLFVGLFSAFHKIPQLSFGDIVGGNIIDLTLVVAVAALISKGLPAESRLIQSSSIFTIYIAFLPLILALDGKLGRGDGLFLIFSFFLYLGWLFSKKERFSKIYENNEEEGKKIFSFVEKFKNFFFSLGKLLLALFFLLIASEGIVRSINFLNQYLHFPLPLIGIFIVGLGNSIPEFYFSIISAKKKENWLILGTLMGSVIVPSTLVLGIVVLLCPFEISDFSPFVIARFFLILSALFFLFFIRTGKKITAREGIALLTLYLLFVISEAMTK